MRTLLIVAVCTLLMAGSASAGLVNYYSFNNDDLADTAGDYSESSSSGSTAVTPAGSTAYVAGAGHMYGGETNNRAVVLDGQGSIGATTLTWAASDPDLDLGQNFTVEAWLYGYSGGVSGFTSGNTGSNFVSATNYFVGNFSYQGLSAQARIGSTGNVAMDGYPGTTYPNAPWGDTGTGALGWFHVALVADGGTATYYLSDSTGNLVTQVLGSTGTMGTNINMVIGHSRFDGYMDDLAMWDEALSAATIESHAMNGYDLSQGPSKEWDGAGSGTWNTGSRWVDPGVPDDTATVTVNAAGNTVTVDAPGGDAKKLYVTAGTVAVSGGQTLTVGSVTEVGTGGTLTVDGALSMSGGALTTDGTIGGTGTVTVQSMVMTGGTAGTTGGITASGDMELQAGSAGNLSAATIEKTTAGTLGLSGTNTAATLNQSAGTTNHSGNTTVSTAINVTGGTLNNTGTLGGGSTITVDGGTLANTNTIAGATLAINSGTMSSNSSTTVADMSVTEGTTVSGTYTVTNSVALPGANTVTVAGGTILVNGLDLGNASAARTLTFTGGTVGMAGAPSTLPVTANLAGHWDASQLTGYSHDQSVTSIPDLSGNGRDMSPVGSGGTYVAGAQNGLAAWDMPGGGHHYSWSNISDARTVFWVFRENVSPGFGYILGSASNYDWHRVAVDGGMIASYADSDVVNATFRMDGTVIDQATTDVPSDFVLLSAVLTGNGASASRFSDARSSQLSRSFDGDIGELIIYTSALSAADEEAVGAYLANKWGLTTTYAGGLEMDSTSWALTGDTTIYLDLGDPIDLAGLTIPGGTTLRLEGTEWAVLADLGADWEGIYTVTYNNTGDMGTSFVEISGTVIPEPATMALLAIGGIGMLLRRRRK